MLVSMAMPDARTWGQNEKLRPGRCKKKNNNVCLLLYNFFDHWSISLTWARHNNVTYKHNTHK